MFTYKEIISVYSEKTNSLGVATFEVHVVEWFLTYIPFLEFITLNDFLIQN
jgi:hypothetical protein